MDLRQLEVFEAIMRSGSATSAARELGITQSAVSRILAKFEADLGFDLFNRANGRLSPTRHASEVLLQARGVLEGVSALQALSTRRRSVESDSLTFVTVPSLSYGLIPSVLRAFSETRPNIRFGFDVRTTEATVDSMLQQAAEFAVVALPISHPALKVTPLFRTVSCAVMPASHPLASNNGVTPMDLAHDPMIFLLRRQPTRQLIEESFLRAGCVPTVSVETSNVATACRCAGEGLGIAVVNAMMAGYSATPELAIRPFEPRIHHTVAIVEHSGKVRSDHIQHFVDCMVQEVREKFSSMSLPLEVL